MSPIDAFQQEVQQVTRRYIAEVLAAAQRAVHGIAEATINAAVDQTVDQISYALAVPPPPPVLAHKRAARESSTRDQLLPAVRANPGCTTAQLGRILSIRASSLVRQLRALTQEGALRVQQRASAFPGQPCKMYFVVDPAPHVNKRAVTEPAVTEQARAEVIE